MSIHWMDHYWKNGPDNQTDLVILLALADWANEEGLAFPSQPVLGKKTRLPETSLKRRLKKLVATGWIALTPGRGKGNRTNYQLHKVPIAPEKGPELRPLLENPKAPEKGPELRPLLENPKGSTSEVEKGPKSRKIFAPLINLTVSKNLTVSNNTPPVNTLSGINSETGDAPKPIIVSPPPKPNLEVQNLCDLIVCASPWGVTRSIRTSDVTPDQRVYVLTAAKHEAQEHGISTMAALDGLLKTAEAQVAALPRDQLRFLGDLQTYFTKRNYRIDPKDLTGGNNGKWCKDDRTIDAVRTNIAQRRAKHDVGQNGIGAGSNPYIREAERIRGRLM